MGKMAELFLEIQEQEAILEQLSLEELQSLRPAYNPMVNNIIEKLIKEKEYEQTTQNNF